MGLGDRGIGVGKGGFEGDAVFGVSRPNCGGGAAIETETSLMASLGMVTELHGWVPAEETVVD